MQNIGSYLQENMQRIYYKVTIVNVV